MKQQQFKPRKEWPHVLALPDLLRCVPFLTREAAQKILEAHGAEVNGTLCVSRLALTNALDGDVQWEKSAMGKAVGDEKMAIHEPRQNPQSLLKVEARVSDKAKGIITIRLLNSGKPVAAASLPANLFDELGAALMMAKQQMIDDGIIKPGMENHPISEFTTTAKF